MEDVAKGGRTVLLVSHDLTAIRALTQKVLFLNAGKIKFGGSTPTGVDAYIQASTNHRGQVPTVQKRGEYARVLQVELLDKCGLPTDKYFSDTPLILAVVISTSGAKGLSFDLHIVNSHGERIYCYNSRLFDEVDIPASSGTYRIRLV